MTGFAILSPILRRAGDKLAYRCPGCDCWHVINVFADRQPRWTWNGSVDAPTFQPSVLNRTGRAVDPAFVPEPGDPPEVCHVFVTDGKIQFLHDCTHHLAGQTVPIPPFDGETDAAD
jgi:hypothetical protein